MDLYLGDEEINNLISEEKIVDREFENFFNMKSKRGHKELNLPIDRNDGSSFRIIIRQNIEDALDFSVILGYVPSAKNVVFILRRYNGKSHEHTNRLDDNIPFYDFHIHQATEKYQKSGFKEEFFAESTGKYSNLRGALKCFFEDCNIRLKQNPQIKLELK